MSETVDKSKSPFDSESEEDTIALSKNEMDNILSEAEIVQENTSPEEDFEPEEETAEGPKAISEEHEFDSEAASELLEEGDFDISGEIDELSPEDLENIELEESDIEQYSQELEGELGEELELPEMEEGDSAVDEEKSESEEKSVEETVEVDTEGIQLEAKLEDEMDLDTYLDSVKTDMDIEGINLEEEPSKGEIEKESMEIDKMEEVEASAEEAFKEAGIEGIEDNVEISDEELLKGLEEAGLTPKEEGDEFSLPEDEEPTLAFDEESEEVFAEEGALEEQPFESDVELSEEEEIILSEDLNLEAEKMESEEVVTVSGEELEGMSDEESLPEPGELDKEVTAAETGGENFTIDQTLYNDITVILKYMDNLLGELPEEKIEEFAKSKYFSLYKEVFEKLNLT